MLAPTGGPKDEAPPQVMRTVPKNNQIQYSGNTLTIEFDEFFTVANFGSELIVSPPLKHKPEYKIKGKKLIIKWADTLLYKTTYTFLLGNMVKDVNEGNEAENILITFSTGDLIDTATFEGRVLKINDKTPPENSFIYLSENPLKDSTFFKPDPLYLTRSNKEGFFRFQGLKEGRYQMYYIEDKNGNKKVDPGEYVGFLDSFIEVSYPKTNSHTLQNNLAPDSNIIEEHAEGDTTPSSATAKDFGDSITTNHQLLQSGFDSASASPSPALPLDYYAFPYFPDKQRVVKSIKSLSRNTLSLSWQWGIYPANPKFWEVVENDTFYLPIVFESTEELEITTTGKKSPQILVTNQEGTTLFLSDTLEMLKKQTEIQSNIKPTDSGMLIAFNYPVSPTEWFEIVLEQDSINPDFKWFRPDSHQIHLTFTVEEGAEYKARFKDSSLLYLDTVYSAKLPAFKHRFNPPPVPSNHLVNLVRTASFSQNNPLIAYVFKGEETLPYQTYFIDDKSNSFEIKALEEGSYTLWIVVDQNNNRIWDLGNIKTQKQPEPLFILDKPMEVKEGWDTDFIWELKP